MTPEEIENLKQDVATAVLNELSDSLNITYWEELLDKKALAEDWKVDPETIRACAARKVNPLPLKGRGARITRKQAREWRNHFYNK